MRSGNRHRSARLYRNSGRSYKILLIIILCLVDLEALFCVNLCRMPFAFILC
ncbi:unnamed protein product [Chondrus crispus]|uniref:Uncharacterized protein n=1 Tax=Chondrus crispus TaxID=2769 RepID=R7QH28_CHOCR|nr:unnamed protein product [Chondrus crispus]CDF37038.1 unnamed protein product [Chondrus crispus]|eukprot:XP_005716857.1 unnamed protein product [Chondrus crispus]